MAETWRCAVFLVEDEALIRMMVADMLKDLGCSIAGEAGNIPSAIELAGTTEFDIAILDVNVAGAMIDPVADLIASRNRPFIFATGYGLANLPERHRGRPFLLKPFEVGALEKAIKTALIPR